MQQFQAIRRSRGGLTSKIHAIVDTLGNPMKYEVTARNVINCVTGYERLRSEELVGINVIADRGYDTDKILALLDSSLTRCNPKNLLYQAFRRFKKLHTTTKM